jgi:alpha-amylase
MKKSLRLLLLLMLPAGLFGQDIMFQGWHWNYPNTVNGRRYILHLNDYVPALGNAGFTYLWLPPLSYATGGTSSNGYDIQDYFDVGMYRTPKWGIRQQLNTCLNTMQANGIRPVADMVYNHRDGGDWEPNQAVEGWIENMNAAKIQQGDQPYPSDRFICSVPLGGNSGNGAGTYYFKIRSASQAAQFAGKNLTFVAWTETVAPNFVASVITETEPNGGGDCGQANNSVDLSRRIVLAIDGAGCRTDEVAVTIDSADFDASGDRLYFRMYNSTATGGFVNLGDMSDHFCYGLWNGSLGADIQGQIDYRTATDFTDMPSGRGGMTQLNFNPNGSPTQLSGDQDAMLFYYDLDHDRSDTRDTLFEFTRWMWDAIGMRGFRIDAVKHFPASFIGDLMDYLHGQGINPGLVVGESFDYSPAALKGWVDAVNASMNPSTRDSISVRIFDFALRNQLELACQNPAYDVRNVFNNSTVDGAGANGFQVVTFVNNHDFRFGEPNGPILTNTALGYAYILTQNQLGLPSVYYSDYFRNNLIRAQINALMQVHRRYIFGSVARDYLNNFGAFYTGNYSSGQASKSLIYQLRGGPSGRDVLVAINFANTPLQVDHTINLSSISVGDTLTDIMGVTGQPFVRVGNGAFVPMTVPPQSFAVWVEGDLTNQLIPIDTTPIVLGNPEVLPVSEKPTLEIFPNPGSAGFQLDVESTRPREGFLEIYSITGQRLSARTVALVGGSNRLLLQEPANLPAGAYWVRLSWDETVLTGKFVKQ